MEKKIKFIIIGLAGLLCVFFFIIFQLNSAKQALEREKNNLEKEVGTLSKQNEKISAQIKQLQEQRSSLQKDLERAAQDREELQRRYDVILKDRNKLTEELKKRTAVTEIQRVTLPQTDDAYWAGVLKTKTDLELQLDNIRGELKTIQINNEQLAREKSALELDVKNLARENQDLKRQMDYNQKIMDTLSQELVREKNDKFKIQDSLKSIKSENEIFRRQLKSLDSRKINLERRLAETQKENTSLDNRLLEIETLLRDKMLQIDNLKRQLEVGLGDKTLARPERGSIELPPIVVRPQESETPLPASPVSRTGKILAVNRENNFVIIDLGEEAGIKEGDTFQVYRQGNLIASLKVIQTRRTIAACDIKKEDTPVRVGDTIK